MNAALQELIARVVADADKVGWYRQSIVDLAEFAKTEYDPIEVDVLDGEVTVVRNLPTGWTLRANCYDIPEDAENAETDEFGEKYHYLEFEGE